MGRAIIGVVAGYIVMFVVVFVLLTGLYLALGADGAFQEGSFAPSMLWILLMLVVGLAAAIGGGLVCAKIAPGSRAPMALAIVVLVLGLLMSIGAFLPPDPELPTVRSADMSSTEAMMAARTPAWVALLNPIVGAIGVTIGGRMGGRRD